VSLEGIELWVPETAQNCTCPIDLTISLRIRNIFEFCFLQWIDTHPGHILNASVSSCERTVVGLKRQTDNLPNYVNNCALKNPPKMTPYSSKTRLMENLVRGSLSLHMRERLLEVLGVREIAKPSAESYKLFFCVKLWYIFQDHIDAHKKLNMHARKISIWFYAPPWVCWRVGVLPAALECLNRMWHEQNPKLQLRHPKMESDWCSQKLLYLENGLVNTHFLLLFSTIGDMCYNAVPLASWHLAGLQKPCFWIHSS
jgi:hypothetical protein